MTEQSIEALLDELEARVAAVERVIAAMAHVPTVYASHTGGTSTRRAVPTPMDLHGRLYCQVCGRWLSDTDDGIARPHNPLLDDGYVGVVRCPGSGRRLARRDAA